jgi:Fe-S cluster assembly protein SufD
MHYTISTTSQKNYIITRSGEHIFYFENLSAKIRFIIKAQNAHVYIYGLYQGMKNNHFDISIIQEHIEKNSTSVALIKSVLYDHSSLNFTGKIRIEKNAKETKAILSNKNLLLSESASVLSVPQLEILPCEVECTHTTTTIPLDHDQIHYLVSRGMSQNKAKELLINGFMQDVLQYKNAK